MINIQKRAFPKRFSERFIVIIFLSQSINYTHRLLKFQIGRQENKSSADLTGTTL